jgi:hypothetical protein
MAACSDGEGGTTTVTASESRAGIEDGPVWATTLPAAVAATVSGDGSEGARVAWIAPGEVQTAVVDTSTGELTDLVRVNAWVEPIAHPIERPSIFRTSDGGFEIAFTSFQGDGASVFRTIDGAEPELISGEPVPETNLVHVTSGVDGDPIYSWLEMSTLSVGFSEGDAIVENPLVDEHTCDCCNPAPLLVGSDLVVAYRDFDELDEGIVRDVVAARSSDGGETFDGVVPIADDHWFIDGCPFSGPSAVEIDSTLVVAWMDARQAVHPDQQTTTIWVDRSEDGGASFGSDLAVTGDGVHTWPVMALDDQGDIHLVWETPGPEGGLSYARSADAGMSFSEPVLLVGRTEGDEGPPRSPSVAYHEGMLVVTWTDSAQGHVAGWELG